MIRAIARKCGNCGEAGHNSRNCPASADQKEESQRQSRLSKPKVIHIAGTSRYLCSAKSQEWPQKYLGDEFARTLPVCPDCQKIYEKTHNQPLPERKFVEASE